MATTLPKHLHAAYEWTLAAGELDELSQLRGRKLATYARASEANAREHDVTDVDASDIEDLAAWLRAGTRHHSTKKSPAQLQREIDEVLASPGSFSYEEAMAALEKKHAGVKRGGSLRAGHAPVVPKKEIIGFEFQIEHDGQRYWTRLQGSGGQLGAGSLHAVRDLGPKSARVKALCTKLMREAREELRRAGTIRVYQDREDPGQRIRAVSASAIRACRPIVA